MEKRQYSLELILFGFTLVASIGFLSITILNDKVTWIGYGYSALYFVFSIILGISAWMRGKKDDEEKNLQ